MHRLVGVTLLAVAVLLSGCFRGAIYTHITTPLDVNLDNTPVFLERSGTAKGDTQRYVNVYGR